LTGTGRRLTRRRVRGTRRAGSASASRVRERQAVRTERLSQPTLTAKLPSFALFDGQLFLVGPAGVRRALAALLRQIDRARVHAVGHVVPRQPCAAGFQRRVGARRQQHLHGRRLAAARRPTSARWFRAAVRGR
jgi:hypothetical protein